MIGKPLAFVLLLACVSCILATPARPNLSTTFYTKVAVSIVENSVTLSGGGIYAYDVPKGHGRVDLAIKNGSHIQNTHILERADLKFVYIINGDKCEKVPTASNLTSPFVWLSQASYTGTTTINGKSVDNWSWQMNEHSTQTMSVLSSDPNIPVRYVNSSPDSKDMSTVDFLEWKEHTPDWVFYVPKICDELTGKMLGDVNAVVYFANNNWDCADVACSSRVPSGAAQPNYECAEFTARSLAAGGYFPGLSPYAPQSTYENWQGYSLIGCIPLSSYLGAIGFSKQPASPGSVQAAYAAFGNGGDGAWSHCCIGVGSGVVDCHNIAREDHPAGGSFFGGMQALWAP